MSNGSEENRLNNLSSADWLKFTKDFIQTFNSERKIKIIPNLLTTQIEPHDTYAELFDNLHRLNTIIINFNIFYQTRCCGPF